jgi:hypothetical protein
LLPEQLTVNTVAQAEVNLNFGVYERLLAQKLGSVPPIQYSKFAIHPGRLVTNRDLGGQRRLRNHRVEPSFFQGHRAVIDGCPDKLSRPCGYPAHPLEISCGCSDSGFRSGSRAITPRDSICLPEAWQVNWSACARSSSIGG